MTRSWALSGDLARSYVIAAFVLAGISLLLLVLELRGGAPGWKGSAGDGATTAGNGSPRVRRLLIAATGLLALVGLLCAVLRPVAVTSRGSLVGPRVVVLVDASRSIDLPGISGTRRQTIDVALAEIAKRSAEVRLAPLSFGEGAPMPLDARGQAGPRTPGGVAAAAGSAGPLAPFRAPPLMQSDLGAALEAVAQAAEERPSAIVVLSDGRLDRPSADGAAAQTKLALGALEVPVHTVALATESPRDASVRAVRAAGAAVAHQPFSLRIEVGCDGGLSCDAVPVTARELREQGAPTALSSGVAHVVSGKAVIELTLTLDRVGPRIVEIAIQPPPGDTLPDNDTRLITIDVARDRVRVLHVAGRPTYDVRALRMWLKSDASVDVVAFFILRTTTDDVNASQEELALIPFPVDELFSEHLPSFDAVVLQDFNAKPYGLDKHLPRLARYVEKGGGLIMVGGPDAFVPGHYAGTALAPVLPVDLDEVARGEGAGVDLGGFVPRLTDAGRVAPVLAPLRQLIGDDFPEMPGTNVVGAARPGATTLLVHPTRKTASGAPMPVLALGERGSGRTMTLTIDGSHRLLFSAFAASAAGRAHGAFWDAVLGWLMRDPRFEPASVDLPRGCIAGEETALVLRPLPGTRGDVRLKITRLGSGEVVRTLAVKLDADTPGVELSAGALDVGGYSATVEIGTGEGQGPTTRRDFACEKGGDEWADSRPDVERLEAISAATGGRSVLAAQAGSLPLPAATQVASERHVAPILPPWAWTLGAAVLMGAHWIVRRRGGLA